MGIKETLRYFNLAQPPQQEPWDGNVLVAAFLMPDLVTHLGMIPNDGSGVWSDFSAWWTAEVMRSREHSLCRRAVVLMLSNREGGAHVDDLSPAERAARADRNGWQSADLIEGAYTRFTMRAIAEELRITLRALD
jgi:hypothetical protein